MSANVILREISANLLVPAMVILIALLVIAAVCVGSLIVEALTERRHFKVDADALVNGINAAAPDELPALIEGASLLRKQKRALLAVVDDLALPEQDLFSVAQVKLAEADAGNQSSVRFTELITKIGPMMGLICTLIPLGPGIVAMGQGQVEQLSESMLVAFDGTVAGLVAAVITMVITTIRKRWYSQYALIMQALMGALLEKGAELRARHLDEATRS